MFAHEVRGYVGVRLTDLPAIYQMFVNAVYQLLMDSGELTIARKLLLKYAKLKAFLKPRFQNIAAHWDHLGSSKNMT